MKSILISDIETKKETVIPYALNFIKYIDDSIQILHLVDSRKHHAVSSAYADSQSFEVGKKLSYQEILEREKHHTRMALDKILSKEASRLNFPLRVNTIVEENSIENHLSNEINGADKPLILSSSEFKGTIVDDIEEFLELNRKFAYLSLIIPPGMEFKLPEKVIIYHDFKKGDKVNLNDLIEFLNFFKPEITIVDVANKNNITNVKEESEAWKKVKLENSNPEMIINIDILESDSKEMALLSYFESNTANMISVPQQTQYGFTFFKSITSKNLINNLSKPVIIY